MGWVEYATLGILVIGIAILVLSVFSLSGRHRLDPAKEVREMKLEMVEKIAEMKGSVAQALAESMMRFNDQVNDKLTDNNSKSSENIAAFRLSVNNELGTFQEKITTRLNDSFTRLGEAVDKRMGAINEKVEDRLSKGFMETNETFRQISERVKVIDEAQKNIQGLSTEMIGLQNILRNNQARGSFGEFQLNQLLFSVFGDNKGLYQTQYTIREASGKRESVRADAVIFMPDAVIAIDSKFPFSAYSQLFDKNRPDPETEEKLISQFGAEVRKHITDISNKYIIPGLTADFALMFVASDGILAMVHSRLPNVVEYAHQKRVTIVSPTTLVPLLSSLWAVSLDHKRTQYTREIIKQLLALTKDFDKFAEEWTRLNDNIGKLSRQSSEVNSRVEKITNKFDKIAKVELLEEGSTSSQESLPASDHVSEEAE